MLPLAGVTVVSLEQAVAAPFATRQLADLGARVIKVERPGGDFARDYDRAVKGQSAYFVWCNRGKESVVLDLKEPGDRDLLDRILGGADVFVQNLAPGAAERLGLGAGTLRARFPRLIWAGISGYGDAGPYRDKKAFDLLVQCEAGLVSLTGTPEAPARAGASMADIAAAMYTYSGVLAALYERERTGEGSAFDVAMLDALGEWMGQPMYTALYGDAPLQRSGARHPSLSPYGHYCASDGGEVFLSVQSDRDWVALCERVLGRPDSGARSALRRQPAPRAARCGTHRDSAGGLRAEHECGADRAVGGRGHGERAAADDGRVHGASAARRAGPVAGVRLARRAAARDCCRR